MTPNVVADNAHSLPLQLASGSGLIGLGSLYLFLLFLLIGGARTLMKKPDLEVSLTEARGRKKKKRSKKKQSKKDGEPGSLVQIVNLGVLTSFFAYTVFLMASVSIVGSSLIWWLTFGAILSQSSGLKKLDWVNSERSFSFRSLGAIVIMLIAVVGMVVSINHYRADYEMVRGLRLLSKSDLTGFLALEKATRLNPYNERYLSEAGRSYLTAARLSGSRDYYKKAEESLRKAVQTNPKETDSYVFLADLYRLEGAVFGQEYFDKSIKTASEALEICGYLYSAYFVRGLSYLALNDWPSAIRDLKQALEFKPDLPIAWYGLGKAYQEEGENEKAKEALEKAVELEPDNEEFKKALESLSSSVTTKG
jgi:tetratricopeptide (TPR) repeat protein